MASLLASPPETFTGANGATPNTANTLVGLAENGGTWQIQGNQGRLRSGATQYNRISSRITGTARADAEVLFDWVIPAPGTEFPNFYARHSNANIDTAQGYYFTLERDQMEVGRAASYSGTAITVLPYTGRVTGDVMRTRVAVFGNSLKARTWLASGTENTGAWDISVTDSVISAAGYFGWTMSSATAGAKDIFLDNINAFDVETPTQKKIAVGGTLTPGGELLKLVPKRFAGVATSAGAVATRRLVVRAFSGSIAAVGPFRKQAVKLLAGTVAPAKTFTKVPRKMLAGTISPSATIMRRAVRRFGGSVTPSSSLNVVNAGRAFGLPGIVVMKVVKAGAVRARVRRG